MSREKNVDRPELSLVQTRNVTAYGATPEPSHRPSLRGVAVAMLLLVLGVFASLVLHSQIRDALSERDAEALERAGKVLRRTLRQEQNALASMVGVLADDTRVRAAVMTPEFNEASVRDQLEDLKKASTASVLAILDLGGKVRAITGADELRNIDLGSSAAIRAAAEKPQALVWTFPSQVLVIGIAPIHSGAEPSALFMMGVSLGERALTELRDTLGVEGAVLIGDRIAAASTQDPIVHEALKASAALEDDKSYVVDAAGHPHLVRVVKTSGAGTAARVALAVLHLGHAGILPIFAWSPALVGLLGFVFVMAFVRRSAKGESA